MKKIAVSFLALAMSIVSVSPSMALAAGSATLTLSPTNTSVDTGDNFSLSVMVTPNGESLDTARVELDWDASKLEVLSFDLGSLFPYLSPSNEIDNTNGDLSYGAFKFGTPVTSSGTLATVTFHALASGSTTISVLSSSKLISDGEEKINTSALGSSAITVSGATVESEAPVEEEEEVPASTGSGTSTSTGSLEEQALVYFGAFYGRLPSSGDDWSALHCIAYGGCKGDPRDLASEQEALVIFGAKYATMPSTDMEWNVIDTLAYTDFLDTGEEAQEEAVVEEQTEEVAAEPEMGVEEEIAAEPEMGVEEETELSLEAQGLVYFGAFYGRMPSSGDDWSALHCIAYGGCQGDPRDLAAEQDSLVIFGAKYAKMPATSMEWNVIHTLAYTDFLQTDEIAAEPEMGVEAEEEIAAEPEMGVEGEVVELTLEQQAIGWFGSLTGYLPSSDADWLAVDYMVNGYTPQTQDLEAESAAITTYVSVFGALPSSDSDWNIIAAIAYSGAF
ncbi:MAG: cohesin domain-containing protein [Patescibacteria group bacterium]